MAAGVHFHLDFSDCQANNLNDLPQIVSILKEAAIKAGATIVGEVAVPFQPQGVTGVIVLSESHISFHSFPEVKYIALDVFTCGTRVNPEIAVQYLQDIFKPKRPDIKRFIRGEDVDYKLPEQFCTP
jgi:S-adenosylmethionine decarboxylase proenzyme